MFKKDYIAISAILKEYTTNTNKKDIECIVIRLAEYFKQNNVKFDASKFIKASLSWAYNFNYKPITMKYYLYALRIGLNEQSTHKLIQSLINACIYY